MNLPMMIGERDTRTMQSGNRVAKPVKMSISETEDMNMNLTSRIAIVGIAITIAVFRLRASNNSRSAPVSYSSMAEFNRILGALNQASQSTQNDLSRLRIERWKIDSNTKRQTQNDTESFC